MEQESSRTEAGKPSKRDISRQMVGALGLTATLSLLLWAGVALAGGPGHGPFGFLHIDHSARDAIHQLIQDLELNDAQNQQLESVHNAFMHHMHGAGQAHEQHLQALIGRLENGGYMDPAEVRQTIDQHIEKIREQAYSVADPLVGLLNSLDADQRALLLDHLKDARAHADHHRKAHGHDGSSHQGSGHNGSGHQGSGHHGSGHH